jgi:hypothetical protein
MSGRPLAVNIPLGLAILAAAASGIRRAALPQRMATLATLLSVIVTFTLIDLVKGGQRGTVVRFSLPTAVGMAIGVALMMSRLKDRTLAVLIGVAAAGGLYIFKPYFNNDIWWTKGKIPYLRNLAEAMGDPGTAATTLPGYQNGFYLITVSEFLKPDTPLAILRPDVTAKGLKAPVYILYPHDKVKDRIEKAGGRPIDPNLWVVEKEGPI